MPTTFLDLTNKLLLGLGEVTVTQTEFPSVRNVQAAAKSFILDAVDEINSREHEWPFNYGTATQVCTVGQTLYPFTSLSTTVDWESFRIQKNDTLNTHTIPLQFVNKDKWYKFGRPNDDDAGADGRGVPRVIFATNSGGFGISPSPNEAYTILYNRWVEPTRMVLFDDTPTIPSRFDYVIIDMALIRFNRMKDNVDQIQLSDSRAERSLSTMRAHLMNKQDKMESTVVNFGDRRFTSGDNYHE